MSFAASVLGRNLRSKVKQRSVATFWSAHPVQQEAEKIEKKVIRKTDLIKVVAEAHNLSQAESGRIVGTIFDTITDVSSLQQFPYPFQKATLFSLSFIRTSPRNTMLSLQTLVNSRR